MLQLHFEGFADIKIFAKYLFVQKLSGELSFDSRKYDMLQFSQMKDANWFVQMP